MHSSSLTTTTPASNDPHYPSISTLRRSVRPSNIDLTVFDVHHAPQQSNDPGIYSAPICYPRQANHSQAYVQQPYTASFHSSPQPVHPHRLPSHAHVLQNHVHHYQQQQQQHIVDPFASAHHTPHTFPLQTSPSQYQQYFHFPPARVQHVNGQIHEPWSNSVLNPMMVERMNEDLATVDADDDPSASIEALVGVVDDQQRKSIDPSKMTSITPPPHIYLRGTSHILTTPPNPLASDHHPDNQLNMNQSFSKTYSPIHSAGFDLPSTATANADGAQQHVPRSASFFSFDRNTLEQTTHANGSQGATGKTNGHSKASIHFLHTENSTGHRTSSKTLSHMLQSGEYQRTSSPLSTDVKHPSLDPGHPHSKGAAKQNGHYCSHPDCDKLFANKSALAKHKLTHSQDRKHKCPKCSKGFKRLDHLHGHMLTHEEDKPHKCRIPNCKRTYCDARSLKRHIENAHQNILAAIHEGGHEDYRNFLPDTAFVKTKDATMSSDFSIDSIDSNSPHSFVDAEQSTRPSNGSRLLPTYTFDEEKSVECHICERSFKNGAALNGHMRLHGGFHEKQPTAAALNPAPKRKRPATVKRKRLESPSSSNETNQSSMTIKDEKHDVLVFPAMNTIDRQAPLFNPFPRYEQTLPPYFVKQPLSVPASMETNARQSPLPLRNVDDLRMNPHSEIRRGSSEQNIQRLSTLNPHAGIKINGSPFHTSPNQTQVNANKHQATPPSNSEFHHRHPSPSKVPSPFSTVTTDHGSPMPPASHTPITNAMQPSPSTHSTSSSCSSLSSSSQATGGKRDFHEIVKQNISTVEDRSSPSAAHIPNSTKDHKSAFLIGTPSSTGMSSSASSSSASSTHTHFNYDNIVPAKQRDSTPSTFQWPSQFRKQLSLDMSYPRMTNQPPSTPYTPPPMLSPFRKGPGLYYRVFSQPTPAAESNALPSASSPHPSTPSLDGSSSARINIGSNYQASIPSLQTDTDKGSPHHDDLLFSPSELSSLDEQLLANYEQLIRTNPRLLSPRNYPLELVYMLLHEYQGDMPRTIAALLNGAVNDVKSCRPLHAYHFPECVPWTPEEMRAFTKALQNSEKNFQLISQTVRTKTVKQCIEFYYMPKVNQSAGKLSANPVGRPRRKRARISRQLQVPDQIDDDTSSPLFTEIRSDDDSSPSTAHFSCDIDQCSKTFTTGRACRAHRKDHFRTKNGLPSTTGK